MTDQELVDRLNGPTQWGYMCLADGWFIKDNAPEEAATLIERQARQIAERDAVASWLAGRDTGISSKTIALWLQFGVRRWDDDPPHDPADLGRCLRLLQAHPHLKPLLPKMAELGGLWPTFVKRWDVMAEEMQREVGIDWSKGQSAPATYGVMIQVREEARAALQSLDTAGGE